MPIIGGAVCERQRLTERDRSPEELGPGTKATPLFLLHESIEIGAAPGRLRKKSPRSLLPFSYLPVTREKIEDQSAVGVFRSDRACSLC
jgi:hypothetical protein